MNEVPAPHSPESEGAAQNSDLLRSGIASSTPAKKRPRWLRRCVIAFAVLTLLTAMLPALISTFGGRFWFAGTLATRFDADVDIGALSLSWTAEQKIEGLRIEGARATRSSRSLRAESGTDTSPTPEVRDAPPRFLDIPHATVKTTLWNLLFTKNPLVLEVSGARVHLRRHEDGSFNVAGILDGTDADARGGDDEATTAEKLSDPASAGLRAMQDVVRSPKPSGWLPSLGRRVEIELENVDFEFDDRTVGSSIRVHDVDAKLIVGPEQTSFLLSGDVVRLAPLDDEPGKPLVGWPGGRIDASAVGSGWETPLEDLQAGGFVEVRGLALSPYAPMLREYAKFDPPDSAFAMRLDANTVDGNLHVTLDADAGAVEIRDAECELPLVGFRKSARARIPLTADLGRTISVFRDHFELPSGGQVEGRLDGTIVAESSLSIPSIRDLGWAALEGLAFELRAESEDFEFRMPTSETLPDVVSPASGGFAFLPAEGKGEERRSFERVDSACRLALTGSLTGFGDHRLALPSYIRVAGELDLAGAFEFGETKAHRLSTSYVVTGGELEFRDTTAIVGGGRLRSQRGWLNFDVTPATYGFDLEAQNVDASYELSSLLAYAVPFLALDERRGELRGRFDGWITLSGKGFESGDAERYLGGIGELNLSKGYFRGSRVFRHLGTALGQSLDPIAFESLAARVDIGDGRIVTQDVRLRLSRSRPERDLGWVGSTTFRNQIEHRVELSVLEETIATGTAEDLRLQEALRSASAASRAASESTACEGHMDRRPPLRLTGTLVEPVVSFSPIPGLSIPVDRLLEDLLER